MRKLILALAAAGAIAAAVPAAASAKPDVSPLAVCNEAENSWHGGYTVAPGVDPNPPAFLRGEQMRLGNGHGAGLVHAAERSPSKAVCGDLGDDTGGDTGGGDDDPINS
jgi:hypothetical protein